MAFSLILQHTASRKEYVVNGLEDKGTPLSYVFQDFVMPEDAPEGEYQGYLIYNGRKDVEYELKDVVLDSILHTEDGDVKLKDLRPEIFLMRYGVPQSPAVYRDNNTEYYYRKK